MGEPGVRYQPPAAPGAPRHAQNRLTFIEAKHAARARVRHSRANPVLDPLEGCGPRQIFVGRQLREIERAIIGRHGRKDEPLLALDRELGLVVDDNRMEDFGAYRHLQQHRGFGAGFFFDILDDPRPIVMATPANFLGNIPDLCLPGGR